MYTNSLFMFFSTLYPLLFFSSSSLSSPSSYLELAYTQRTVHSRPERPLIAPMPSSLQQEQLKRKEKQRLQQERERGKWQRASLRYEEQQRVPPKGLQRQGPEEEREMRRRRGEENKKRRETFALTLSFSFFFAITLSHTLSLSLSLSLTLSSLSSLSTLLTFPPLSFFLSLSHSLYLSFALQCLRHCRCHLFDRGALSQHLSQRVGLLTEVLCLRRQQTKQRVDLGQIWRGEEEGEGERRRMCVTSTSSLVLLFPLPLLLFLFSCSCCREEGIGAIKGRSGRE